MNYDEVPLQGGNVNKVVRVKDTVRRPIKPWSDSIHNLLLYLEKHNFSGAPQYLGIDQDEREILTYIPGDVGHYPLKSYMWSDESLIAMAKLLRQFHDITAKYVSKPNSEWMITYPDKQQHEVICHNDAAPYNTVFRDGKPIALIDFDTAGPGPRIWDVAYTVYRFVPLSSQVPSYNGQMVPYEPSEHAHRLTQRLKLFCITYGIKIDTSLLDMVEHRLKTLCNTITEEAEKGDSAFQRMIEEGHITHYQNEISFIQKNRKHWETYLLD